MWRWSALRLPKILRACFSTYLPTLIFTFSNPKKELFFHFCRHFKCREIIFAERFNLKANGSQARFLGLKMNDIYQIWRMRGKSGASFTDDWKKDKIHANTLTNAPLRSHLLNCAQMQIIAPYGAIIWQAFGLTFIILYKSRKAPSLRRFIVKWSNIYLKFA